MEQRRGKPVIGIMGGTFDPIHYGHLVTAEASLHSFKLDRVIFVPTGKPPHKRAVPTDAKHRYLMTVLATVTNPNFEVSRIEIDREGVSYTVDTMREFRRRYGPDATLYFISGADAILEILTWREPVGLLEICHFIAATRPGYPLGRLEKVLNSLEAGAERIHPVEVPALAISSTDIRNRVKEGRPIRYLVPDTVEYYIRKNGLYREG